MLLATLRPLAAAALTGGLTIKRDELRAAACDGVPAPRVPDPPQFVSRRSPVLARSAMVACSQPLAAE